MLVLNLHSKQISLLGFFYFELFICPLDVKRPKYFGDSTLEPLPGLRHELIVELTAP